jgi:hypothetical protein
VDFDRLVASQTGSNVAIGKFDHGFLIVSNTHYWPRTRRLKVIPNLLTVDYGEMSISTARRRLKLEMRSPVDRANTVFYSCFVDNYRLPCNVSTLLALFLLPKMAEKLFRPLESVLGQK